MDNTTTIKVGRNKVLMVLVILASIAIGVAVADIIIVGFTSRFDDEFRGYAAEEALLSQSIAKDADQAVTGDTDAFQRLLNARQQFDKSLNLMLTGNSATMMPGATGDALTEATLIQGGWSEARKSVQTLLDARDSIILANQTGAAIDAAMPDLLAQWEKIAKALSESNDTRRTLIAAGQTYLGGRIQAEADTLVSGAGDVSKAAAQFQSDITRFYKVDQALIVGDAALDISPVRDPDIRPAIEKADSIFSPINENLQTLTSLAAHLLAVHKAVRQLDAGSNDLLDNIRGLQDAYERQIANRLIQPMYGYIIGGVGLIILLITLWIYLLSGDARKAAVIQQRQNERNQEAILRLLDELGSLADGDLTVEVTVTEDITGAIADSINYALEALRDLVRTINDTSAQVDAAARQTRATATHLAEASDNQTRQITTATGQITQMAHSIEQVSANAERSAQVARQSVEIAHKGGAAVRRTIDGMNAIRETIQETSKRIKRLGESSQEIGDIVELINDIAEQTNILALNAAIQASMAGEAGRGFAVVADEVQRLAERSANATRQIEALVKTIQTDTNEAVTSMEQSTSGVVGTAQLAENAGSALDEIEKVSNNIATLIQSISSSARQQAQAAGDVSRTMSVIQEITAQTSEGTNAAAQSIGQLAELATELRTSVAGFKLPEQHPAISDEADVPMAEESEFAVADEAYFPAGQPA
ncbi:MAG TPA: methyl-accepting chemotaxis protein [Gammaproteobacteria bacterium]|jgi:twitching motility protein PilJ|nr:methyl-accepting chemotaxis protein [Gammaproteobacteria bacterium]